MHVTRREALLTLGWATVALRARSGAAAPVAAVDRVSLPPLPYPAAALEPHIDARTMEIHHGRHHRAYVDKLNEVLATEPAVAAKPLDQLLANLESVPESIRSAVRNNGGGHVNHVQFWAVMTPRGGGAPTGAAADAITGTFGSFEAFKKQMNDAGADRFGSGWAWLSEERGKLVVHSTPNQDTPGMDGRRAIFGIDVWEHAYYLKYQNRRPDYLDAWWNVINWEEVNKRLKG